jgi:hypothetical protein
MTGEELAAIRERAESATQGPWEQPAYPVGDMVYRLTDRSPDGLIAKCERPTDADFIAHARTDIPALLAELDRLRLVMARSYADVIKHGEQGRCDCWTCDGVYEMMTEQEAGVLLAKDEDSAPST